MKGIKGCWITLAEYDKKGEVICVKSAMIDGVNIRENVWLTLKDGIFTETTDEQSYTN